MRNILVIAALACACSQSPIAPPTYTIGGTVSGLVGTGLVLQDNGRDDLTVSQNGAFTFATKLAGGAAFAVTVKQQPTGPIQVCSVTGGSGTASADVTKVAVKCTTSAFTVGGTVTGLKGTGLVLEDNGTDDLPVTDGGSFVFATPVESGKTFTVTIKTQPMSPTQVCTVIGGSGTIVAGPVTSVAVNCSTSSFTIGGTVTGLAGTGLVLQNNGGDDLPVTSDGTFAFATPVASGTPFQVNVKTQPLGPSQTCTVTAGSGTIAAANVTTVAVACVTNAFTVGGTTTGLAGTGLVLQDNLGDNLPITGNGGFTFPTAVASGHQYSVTILTQPTSPSQTCAVSSPSGTIGATDVTDVAVTCTTNTYSVGGTVSGLVGRGLVLQDNGSDNLAIASSGPFSFPTSVASGASFTATVLTQPSAPAQVCTISGATGTIGSGAVNTVQVNCATNTYAVGGSVSGLVGSGLALVLNGGTPLPITSNGAFAFPTPLTDGSDFAVTISGQPTGPSQTCTLTGAAGSVQSAPVTTVQVTCATNAYPIGGTITGLSGGGLVLDDNGGDALLTASNGPFTFATSIASGQPYTVTVATQPTNPAQTCTVTSGTGTVGAGAITNVQITCTTNTYPIGGAITGLTGTVVLQDNGADNLTLTANGAFTFPTAVASGAAYVVTVAQQPTSPSQICTVSGGAGVVGTGPVASVVVTCVTNQFTIGGSVTGLAGHGLVLQNNGANDLAIASNGAFSFSAALKSGDSYNVTITSQPSAPDQTCTVSGGKGTVGASPVTSVTVNCITNTYTVGGTVTGLGSAKGLVLQNNGGDSLSVSGEGSFSFATPVPSGTAYDVTVFTQPISPWETCAVTGARGLVTDQNVTSVTVTCTANTYHVDASVSGLSGGGLVLQDNGGDNLAVSANGTATFATPVASGATYAVTVLTQPTSPWQTCTATAGTGTMAGSDVTVDVACTTNTYTIGGTVAGLTGTGLALVDNGTDSLSVAADGAFTFNTPVASGMTYAVTVGTQPTSPTEVCAVTNGSGTVGGANVTSVAVTCSSYGDWLVGTPCNGVDYGGGCTPAETGYHYKGSYSGFQCWWHTKNQAWNTSTSTDIYQLAQHFSLDANSCREDWCYPFSDTPSPTNYSAISSYDSSSNVGAWGWCGGAPFTSGGWVCCQ